MSRLPVCDACLANIRALQGQLCAACGERVVNVRAFEIEGPLLCAACRQSEPAFTRAAAYGSYDGALRELIHLLKYEHVRPAANVLGRMVAEVAAGFAADMDVSIIIPVPLHASKLRQRGFNQSELIARAASKLLASTGSSHPKALELNTCALVRKKNTESQTGLTPAQRHQNMRAAFAVVRVGDVRGRDILLVDDVMTTGATANECARALRRAGAARVFVATVARALKPQVERLHPPSDSPQAAEKVGTPLVMAAHA